MNKSNSLIGLIILFITQLGFSQSEFSASGYNSLRIENEIKLSVPLELSDSLWSFISDRYDNDGFYLQSIDQSFNCKMAIDSFTDQYFDNKNLDLLGIQSGVRYRSRYVLTDEPSRKDGRELMQLKINDIANNPLSRGEYKYKIKHYNEIEDPIDTHPFLGLVKRSHRDDLSEQLRNININSLELFPTIKITQIRKRIYVYKGETPFSTLTLDKVRAEYLGKSCIFLELELELNEIGYTESDSLVRKEMEKVNETIKLDVLNRFSRIEQDQTPKYNKAAYILGLNSHDLEIPIITDYQEKSSLKFYLFGGGILIIMLSFYYFLKKRKLD